MCGADFSGSLSRFHAPARKTFAARKSLLARVVPAGCQPRAAFRSDALTAENDGTGLTFLRVRYYSPALQRFISDDPIGIGGGINQTICASDNPLSATDPLGLKPSNPRDDSGDGGSGNGGNGGSHGGSGGGNGGAGGGGGNGPSTRAVALRRTVT